MRRIVKFGENTRCDLSFLSPYDTPGRSPCANRTTWKMPPLSSCPIPIDPEWAESLVSLRLNVPSHWWPDFDGDEDNLGTIAAVNFTQTNRRYFQLLLDGDKGEDAYYSMQYDAVLAFFDVNQPLFSSFSLPHHPITNPEGEES